MYDPRFRMAILISFFVMGYAIFQVLTEYIFGTKSFDLPKYLEGVVAMNGAVIGGLVFVLICTKFITFSRLKLTGFEPTYVDEVGTGFNFPVSLSKFLPDIIAAPKDETISPVEQELIGFLNGYRDWPYDISGEDKSSLFAHALTQWRAMRLLAGTHELHAIAALAQDLGKVYAYQEGRKHPPFWQFWRRDKVSYKRRCIEHGGLSAFVLSTIPSFLRMEERKRRAVLIAVRYRDNPIQIPANCDPLAMEIYEYLHRAKEKAMEMQGSNLLGFQASDEDLGQLKIEITSFFQSIIRSLEVNPIGQSSKSDGIYLGDGILVVRMGKMVRAFAPVLSPQMRSRFQMWGLDGKPHPSWKGFIDAFRDLGVLEESYQNVSASDGLFGMRVGELDYSNSLVIRIDITRFTDLRTSLDALPRFNGIINVVQSEEALLEEINSKANRVNDMLGALRQNI